VQEPVRRLPFCRVCQSRQVEFARHPENPPLHLAHSLLRRRQFGLQEPGEAPIAICERQPGCDAERVVLVAGAVCPSEAAAPQGGIDFSDRGPAGRHLPPVERPDMYARTKALPKEAQPGDAGMGGLGHGALHVEMEHRLRAAGPQFRRPPPPRITHPRRAVPGAAIADEIDIGVILVRWPVALEVVEEARPVQREAMRLEVAQGEGQGCSTLLRQGGVSP